MADIFRINRPPTHKPLYRVYHLDRAGHIDYAEVIEALDDEDAIARLRAIATRHGVELWDRGRFVAKIEPPVGSLVPEVVVVRDTPEREILESSGRSVERLFGIPRRFH